MPKDYIELLIVGADGIRRKFVGYGELIEVDNIEPVHTLMVVKAYDTPIVNLTTARPVAQLQIGDAVEVYTHVRQPFRGELYKMVAVGEWKGHYVKEAAIERALPATKPFTPLTDEEAEDASA